MTATLEHQAPTTTPHADPHHARRWWVLAVLALAQLMVVLDGTIVNIALPSAQHALGFSDDGRQWVVTGYSLAFGSLLLLGGRLSDAFGRKRMFLTGVAGFAAASAVGGAATGFTMLVVSRAAQGAFGALLAPAALSLLTTTFTDPRERGKAFGIYGAIAGAGAAIGLLLGGALTSYLSWRWCLYVNLAFAALAFAGGQRLLVQHRGARRAHIDVPGAVTVASALFFLVYGLAHAETASWSSVVTLVSIALGVVGLAAFVAIERRVEHPLLPLGVVLDRTRGGAYLSMVIAGAGMFAVFLFLTYFLQRTLGWSPVRTGVGFLPMVAALMVTATSSTAVLLPRFGPRPLSLAGLGSAAVGLAWLTQIGTQGHFLIDVLGPEALISVGIGQVFVALSSTSLVGVDPDDAGVASALVNTAQQVGGSLGVALLNTIATSATNSWTADHEGPVATVHGYTVAFWVSTAVMIVSAVVVGGFIRASRADLPAEGALAVA